MAKGNGISVFMRKGDDITSHDFTVTRAGRTLEAEILKDSGSAWLQVTERTRGGTTVATARYRMDEIVGYREDKESADGS